MDGGEEHQVVYLAVDDVIGLHAEALGVSDAVAANQLRDAPALESALTRPSTHAHYNGADIATQAAVLAHGIAETQVFIDGNKRTALVAMLTFLAVNGYSVRAPETERAEWILGFASGKTIEDLAQRLREVIEPKG